MIIYRYITHEVVLVGGEPARRSRCWACSRSIRSEGAGLAPINISDGRLFIRINELLYCYDIKKH